jgi:hypothetical protein
MREQSKRGSTAARDAADVTACAVHRAAHPMHLPNVALLQADCDAASSSCKHALMACLLVHYTGGTS